MQDYRQFCPVARGAEIFACRWTPLIIRELLYGNRTFGALLRGLPRISRSVLAERLAWLERHGMLERCLVKSGHGSEYVLTQAGEELQPVVQALGSWGYKWVAKNIRREDLDPDLLMWFLRRRVRTERLPDRRVVLEVRFSGVRQAYWLVLERSGVDLCLFDPGFDIDLLVHADLRALIEVYLGLLPLDHAMREGLVRVDGPPAYRRGFIEWIGVSPFAPTTKAATKSA